LTVCDLDFERMKSLATEFLLVFIVLQCIRNLDILKITVHMVVQAVVKANSQSNWSVQISTPSLGLRNLF